MSVLCAGTLDKRARHRKPSQNDAKSSLVALEQEQWEAMYVWVSLEWVAREARTRAPAGKQPGDLADLAECDPKVIRKEGKRHARLHHQLVCDARKKFPDVNWVMDGAPACPCLPPV